jgi:DNA-binding NarL/FixJ family response regulator
MHDILLVDDHPIVRQGLRQLIAFNADFHVCAEADDWGTAIDAAGRCAPRVIILDISLEKRMGLDLIRELLAVSPRSKVLILSMHDEVLYAERAIKSGASGYVMKANATGSVLEAIQAVIDGEIYLSDKMKNFMLRKQLAPASATRSTDIPELTNREVEVLKLIAQGLGTPEISERMCLSPKTVEVHRGNIRAKLKLAKGDRLVEVAIRYTRESS